MNRSEHMAWCKARALELVDSGDNPHNSLNKLIGGKNA